MKGLRHWLPSDYLMIGKTEDIKPVTRDPNSFVYFEGFELTREMIRAVEALAQGNSIAEVSLMVKGAKVLLREASDRMGARTNCHMIFLAIKFKVISVDGEVSGHASMP